MAPVDEDWDNVACKSLADDGLDLEGNGPNELNHSSDDDVDGPLSDHRSISNSNDDVDDNDQQNVADHTAGDDDGFESVNGKSSSGEENGISQQNAVLNGVVSGAGAASSHPVEEEDKPLQYCNSWVNDLCDSGSDTLRAKVSGPFWRRLARFQLTFDFFFAERKQRVSKSFAA